MGTLGYDEGVFVTPLCDFGWQIVLWDVYEHVLVHGMTFQDCQLQYLHVATCERVETSQKKKEILGGGIYQKSK